VDSGFVKLFVSTEKLDMGWIVQKSLFKSNFGPSVRLTAGREKIDRGQVWDAIDVLITMRI
jgi:hypothetical protein